MSVHMTSTFPRRWRCRDPPLQAIASSRGSLFGAYGQVLHLRQPPLTLVKTAFLLKIETSLEMNFLF